MRMIMRIFKESLKETTRKFFGNIFSFASVKVIAILMTFLISLGLCIKISFTMNSPKGTIIGLFTGFVVFMYLINFIEIFEKNWNDRYRR